MESMTVTVGIARKISLPNYENVDLSMMIHNVEAGATEAEIEEALETGNLAFQVLMARMKEKMQEVKRLR